MFNDLLDEVRTIFKGKTLDALVPPLLFIVFVQLTTFNLGVIVALLSGVGIFLLRLVRKRRTVYALFGLFGVAIAALFAYVAGTASNYFFPQVLSAGALMVITGFTLIFNRPLAAWLSHLTRNFPLIWYWRKDVLPAYREVTIFWLVLLIGRFVLLLNLYLAENVIGLAWANTLLGFPVTVLVLILTYIYGIVRLRQLGGPSVDEFKQDVPPPWQSQRKGF